MIKSKGAFLLWTALAVIYVVISVIKPISRNRLVRHYHLSTMSLHVINLSIIIPVLLILFFAYVGFINLRRYHLSIAKTQDGEGFKFIAAGIGIFTYGSLVSLIVSSLSQWIARDIPSYYASSVRVDNYVSLLVPLLAFGFISSGMSRLITVGRLMLKDLYNRSMVLIIGLLGASYTFIVFHPNNSLNAVAGQKAYFMPGWLVLITIVIPYVFAWSLGLLSILQIITYSQKIKGVVYRANINLLANGLGIVLLSYIVLEYLTSLSGRYTLDRIGWLLLIVYCFLVLIGLGYLFIALGAKRIKKIEEV